MSAQASTYHIPGAAAVTPEDSWYLAALEEYDPKYAAMYRLILNTVREDTETDFVQVDEYGYREVSLDELPYQYSE